MRSMFRRYDNFKFQAPASSRSRRYGLRKFLKKNEIVRIWSGRSRGNFARG